MSKTFERILKLIRQGSVVISGLGYEEVSEDDIIVEDILDSALGGIVIEDYPEYSKGPCVLVLQRGNRADPELRG